MFFLCSSFLSPLLASAADPQEIASHMTTGAINRIRVALNDRIQRLPESRLTFGGRESVPTWVEPFTKLTGILAACPRLFHLSRSLSDWKLDQQRSALYPNGYV